MTLPFYSIGGFMHLAACVLVAWHCLSRPREPRSTLLWLLLTWFLPALGALSYLVLGRNRVPEKGWLKQHSDQSFSLTRISRERDTQPLEYWRSIRAALHTSPHIAANQLNETFNRITPDHMLLGGNSVDMLPGGKESLDIMLEAISNAKHHIHMQSYIIGNDEVGRKLLKVLRTKAEQGITVRLLYDSFGSFHARLGGLLRAHSRVPNLNITGFSQANPLKRLFQLNLRNHRKILVIDGETGFTGGMNFSAAYMPTKHRAALDDYHFKIRGAAVLELQYTFLRDWFFMSDEKAVTLLIPEHFPLNETAGNVAMRVLNSGPTAEREVLTDAFFAAISGARQQILLVTPYFVPPPGLRRALRAAALRGVDVKIILPAENNHPAVFFAARSAYEELLLTGVRIFERNPPFTHAKGLIIDSQVAIFGSANFDERSLNLNYETVMAAFDYDFAARMKEVILADIANAKEVNLAFWRSRPAGVRLLENFFNLMSPVL